MQDTRAAPQQEQQQEVGLTQSAGDDGRIEVSMVVDEPSGTTSGGNDGGNDGNNNSGILRPSLGGLRTRSRQRRQQQQRNSPNTSRIIKNLDKVIFPDGKWIKRWDLLVLGCLSAYLFMLPYQIGVSGGYYLLKHVWWLVINVLINAVFFVDTFLSFRRPYEDRKSNNGKLVIDLKKIRWNYLTGMCIPNIVSVLPYTLIFYYRSKDLESVTSVILLFNLFKLIRFVRLPRILSHSQAVTDIRMKSNSQVIQFCFYVILIIVMSHWFACIWCWVAYLQNETFNFMDSPNWISGWVTGNGGVGAMEPDPLGPENDTDRYVISLFWAIQTVTSIGYGNIAPVTVAEWWVGSVLQLLAGVCWAYVIGGLVGVAAGFNQQEEEYGLRSDQANDLIRYFPQFDRNSDEASDVHSVAKNIRKYIYKQHKHSNNTMCASTMNDNFPVFDSLSPQLQQWSSIMLMKEYLEIIPYLSSQFLNLEDQAEVAIQCSMLEFPAGEVLRSDSGMQGLGRGILIMKSGCAFASKVTANHMRKNRVITVGTVVGMGKVLLEEGHPLIKGDLIHFLTYSKVLFIPRDVVWAALEKNDRSAWSRCASWVYVRTLLGSCTQTEI